MCNHQCFIMKQSSSDKFDWAAKAGRALNLWGKYHVLNINLFQPLRSQLWCSGSTLDQQSRDGSSIPLRQQFFSFLSVLFCFLAFLMRLEWSKQVHVKYIRPPSWVKCSTGLVGGYSGSYIYSISSLTLNSYRILRNDELLTNCGYPVDDDELARTT